MLRRQPWLVKCLGCVGESSSTTNTSGSGSGKERRSSLYTGSNGNPSSTHVHTHVHTRAHTPQHATHPDAHGTSVGTCPLPPAPHQGTNID